MGSILGVIMDISIIDHRKEGYDRLLEVFKDKPNIASIIEVYFKQGDDLERAIHEVLNSRHLSDIDTVVGVQLDIIGSMVGEDRTGRSDEEYREAILLRIVVNNSTSTTPYITSLLQSTTRSTKVKLYNHYPAAYVGEFNGDYIPSTFLASFQSATAAGVNAGFIHNKDDLGWSCCEVGATQVKGANSILPEYTDTVGIGASEIHIVEDGAESLPSTAFIQPIVHLFAPRAKPIQQSTVHLFSTDNN